MGRRNTLSAPPSANRKSVIRACALAGTYLFGCAVAYIAAGLVVADRGLDMAHQAGVWATMPAMPWFLIYQTDQPTGALIVGYITNAGLVVLADTRIRRARKTARSTERKRRGIAKRFSFDDFE